MRDVLIALASFWFALWLRFDGRVPVEYLRLMGEASPVVALVFLIVGLIGRLHDSLPNYASLREAFRLAGIVAATAAATLTLNEIYRLVTSHRALPFSVTVVGSLILFVGLGAARMYGRLASYMGGKSSALDSDRVLIVGAGDAGEHIARDLLRGSNPTLRPVGFVDDDRSKLGKKIHGLPVLASTSQLAEAVADCAADCVIIALPSAPSSVIQHIVAEAAQAGVKTKILPTLRELMNTAPTLSDIRDVDISDLIARHPAKIDISQIAEILDGASVLITGAAGSIGSELVRKALYFRPAKLVMLDNNETELFLLAQRLGGLALSRGTTLEMALADIRDRASIDAVFAKHRPRLVLHAAAYKHVPVMEQHPEEAVTTNITGTRNVAEAACAFGTDRFVLVSTDKAVKPSSVMGATKRVAEMLIGMYQQGSKTAFMAVRFGNVLASRGSVVPIFQEQIRTGGPITVTHAEATRYFMTIEEAVALIFQAAALGQGGETFVLEMGEPVRIIDLADRMRRLLANGKASIEIVVTGLRAGEKLHEDLFSNYDKLLPVYPGILRVAKNGEAARPDSEDGASAILVLESHAAARQDSRRLIEDLLALVQSPSPSLSSVTEA